VRGCVHDQSGVYHGYNVERRSYGSCISNPAAAQSTSGYPSFTDTGSSGEIGIGSAASNDGRIANLDLEGTEVGTYEIGIYSLSGYNFSQLAMNSLYINGNVACLQYYGSTLWGLVNSVCTGMQGRMVGVFFNDSENVCVNGSNTYNCGGGAGQPVFVNINYNAALGNYISGAGASGTEDEESFRTSACRLCVFSNNTFTQALNGGAPFKLHSGNTNGSRAEWLGQYTEMIEISDNLFSGHSGAQIVEVCPQNANSDERIRNVVFERNLSVPSVGGSAIRICAMNATARDNVVNGTLASQQYGIIFSRRGTEYGYIPSGTSPTTCTSGSNTGYAYCSGNSGAPFNGSAPQYNDAFNNTFYATGTGAAFVADTWIQGANNSSAVNNLAYKSGGGVTAVTDAGDGNTVANNTANGSTGNNPAFTNVSAAPDVMASYQPTANYSGGSSVAVFYDGDLTTLDPFGVPWSPTWDLGAIHH